MEVANLELAPPLPVSSTSQPKVPPDQVSTLLDWQVANPAPLKRAVKRLEELAVVLKRLVVVAEVVVDCRAVKFCKVVLPITKRSPEELMVEVAEPPMERVLPVREDEKKLVEVAWVEVLLVMLLKMWAPVQVGEKAWSTVMVFTALERPVEKVRAGS